MPLYEFKCKSCGAGVEKVIPLSKFHEPVHCNCGNEMQRLISAPRVIPDYAGYTCPITGAWIEGRKAHNENLARHGCRVKEAGEGEIAAKVRARSDEQLEKSLEATAEEFIQKLPSAEREALGNFMETHDASYARVD